MVTFKSAFLSFLLPFLPLLLLILLLLLLLLFLLILLLLYRLPSQAKLPFLCKNRVSPLASSSLNFPI